MACPFDEDPVDVEAQIIQFFFRRERVIRPHIDVFAYPNEYLTERYRFSKDSLVYLTRLLKPHIANVTNRVSALSTENILCIALRFFASGYFLYSVGDSEHVGKATVCRAVRTVCLALKQFLPMFVQFPGHKPLLVIKDEFHRVAGFPNVTGCIDGTHIPIKAPPINEGDYVNRKSIHSINVQVICESIQITTNVEAKWPGSVHDARIFRESSLCQTFQQGMFLQWLLAGDRGYPCLPYLMTPYPEPGPQTRFNLAHSRTRAKVEMTIGILKSRFQCLRGLWVSPERACDIIVACVVLHNIATIRGESHPPCIEEDGPEEHLQILEANRDGRLLRDRICQNYFY
ncbi:LOW QUALITY PROTEIN: putative nuclease HARBI1 [Tachysurus vachellii]|uniref:LOW QUALITY PROTEIN: putative nuclease HARBI1 n=1 Tax=Tachysurus vachellii TaxID=175792 RepID=UPI00296AC713|nr:LOW QUALITY PROTEIN: putative nuclease HARBI1 [Tachysurus vachellii]